MGGEVDGLPSFFWNMRCAPERRPLFGVRYVFRAAGSGCSVGMVVEGMELADQKFEHFARTGAQVFTFMDYGEGPWGLPKAYPGPCNWGHNKKKQ